MSCFCSAKLMLSYCSACGCEMSSSHRVLEVVLLRGCEEMGLSGWKQTALQGIPQLSGAVCMGS